MDATLGPRLFTLALAEQHRISADASPPVPGLSPTLCSGRWRMLPDGELVEPGHPDAVSLGDMAERDAVVLVGEIGSGYRITVVPPGYALAAGE